MWAEPNETFPRCGASFALDYTGPCVKPLGDLRAADVGQFFSK